MPSRRNFLIGIGAALAAPAIVKAQNIMPLWVPKREIITPIGYQVPLDLIPCDGRMLSRTIYAELFAVLGTTYGGDQSGDMFAIPDLQPNILPDGSSYPTIVQKIRAKPKVVSFPDSEHFPNPHVTLPAGEIYWMVEDGKA